MTISAEGPQTSREWKILTYFLAAIIYTPYPTFAPGLSEIGDLSYISSDPCFLINTFLF